MMGDGSGRQIDSGRLIAKVERNSRRLKFTHEYGREQMLACVLLHVIESAHPVDVAFNRGSGSDRLIDEVPDRAVIIFLHLLDCNLDVRSSSGYSSEQSGVERLAAAGWVEC
jgi:hypothetical protein